MNTVVTNFISSKIRIRGYYRVVTKQYFERLPKRKH